MNTKLTLYALLMCASAFGFERNEDLEQPIIIGLQDKMLQQMVIKRIVEEAINVPTAVTEFIRYFTPLLSIKSVQISTKVLILNFLSELAKKFPAQEVRIAQLLENPVAYEWLKLKKPNYKMGREYNAHVASKAQQFVIMKDYQNLEKWLEEGNDPSRVLKFALVAKNLIALKLAISYGADVNVRNLFYITGITGTPLDYINAEIAKEQLKEKNIALAAYPSLEPIRNYLIQEGAVTQDELSDK